MPREKAGGMETEVGRVLAVETPPQGCNSRVTTLVTATGRYIRKEGAPAALEAEARMLASLEAFAPFVPRFVGRDGEGFLYTEIPGVNLSVTIAAAGTDRRRRLSAEFGRALRFIHGWRPTVPLPEDDWLDSAVEACRQSAARYEGDRIDNPVSPFHGVSAKAVAEGVRARRPELTTQLVFGHGDWCLPNAMAIDERIVGAVDWADGGWADYRYDLATGLWTLRRNLGEDPALATYLTEFLEGYGYPDEVESLACFEAIYVLR